MKGMKKSFKKLFGIQKSSNGLPGSSATSKADDNHSKNTLERLREMEDLLQRKQSHLESKIAEQVAEARKYGIKNKRAALMALKRKKRLEQELTRIDGTLTTIELQREALESARNNVQVLGAMKDAAGVLKNAHKLVTADKVLDIMDEVNEQQDLAREIADAIANPLASMNAAVDDAELERELEELEQEELDKVLLDVNGVPGASADPHTDNDEPDNFALKAAAGHGASKGQKDKNATESGEVDPYEKELQELAQWST